MSALFSSPSSSADLSECGQYRYRLTRRWGMGGNAVFVMLNPSTADAEVDDPTIRRCIGFARAWNQGGLIVVNLYAYRATKPSDLWKTADPVGPDNDRYLSKTFAAANVENSPVIAAWGANAKFDREFKVADLASRAGLDLDALGVTKDGAPRHPLYMPKTAWPERWTP